MNSITIKKILCVTLILAFSTQTTLAVQNYTVTKTISENYSASSHVGKTVNYSNNGTGLQNPAIVVTPWGATYDTPYYPVSNTAPCQSDVRSMPIANSVAYQPTMQPIMPANVAQPPVYNAGVYYGNRGNYNQTYSVQDIQAPQVYNKTTTTVEQCVDTREKADKIIDRGIKVVGTVAAIGVAAGLLFGMFNK